MRFFLMDTTESQWAYIGQRPKRKDGTFLQRTELQSKACTLRVRHAGCPPDIIRTVGAIYLFSSRVKAAMSRLHSPPDTSFVEVTLRTEGGESEFFAMLSELRYDVLNKEQSEFAWLIPNKRIGKVSKWVLSRSQLPRLDYFRSSNGRWLISERVVTLFDECGFSGLDASKCKTDGDECDSEDP